MRSKLFPDVGFPPPIEPAHRKLRIYSIDPSLALRVDSLQIAFCTPVIPWEKLKPGPIGEYLEVIDYDPAAKCFYLPVDLDDTFVLCESGLPPSLSDPRFHQQMVYAVAMNTIATFEKAWGRKIQWAAVQDDPSNPSSQVFLPRLRLYPHGMRAENAFYDPGTKSIIFGCFRARDTKTNAIMPKSQVFTCLSSDVIAHEMTHAILDGIHPRFTENTNPDALAFHEAFADMVALLQHFHDGDLLRDQIAKSRGDLSSETQLAKLASEFGLGTSGYGALRDALGSTDENGEWKRKGADPSAYMSTKEAHARGEILVSALFDAYLSIYRIRTRDLIRIASDGSGILRAGDIHPDLVSRLASEAVKAADHLLGMIVRAVDYCPPFDLTFGEFLRALITADIDLVGPANDRRFYRVAIIEAFRSWGIYPSGTASMDPGGLCWSRLEDQLGQPDVIGIRKLVEDEIKPTIIDFRSYLDRYKNRSVLWQDIEKMDRPWQFEHYIVVSLMGWPHARKQAFRRRKSILKGLSASDQAVLKERIHSLSEREFEFYALMWLRTRLHKSIDSILHSLRERDGEKVSETLGLDLNPSPFDGERAMRSVEVHSARLSKRISPVTNQETNSLVFIELIQEAWVDRTTLADATADTAPTERFQFRGGCTLVIDLDEGVLRYAIRKGLRSPDRRKAQRDYLVTRGGLAAVYFDTNTQPFAMLHSGVDQ